MKVDVHDRLEAVDPTAWDDLLARSRAPSPFLRWIWQDHQYEFGPTPEAVYQVRIR